VSYSHLVDGFLEHPPALAVPLASFPGYLCAARLWHMYLMSHTATIVVLWFKIYFPQQLVPTNNNLWRV